MATLSTERPKSAARTMQNYVDGRWVGASSDATRDVVDPASGEVLARVPLSSADDVRAAVAAARRAQPAWARKPVIERARLLFRLRELVDARREEFAELLTRDTGKALADARLEMRRAIETIEAATAIPHTMQGKTLAQIATGVDAESFRQPVGVCAAVTAFNFPAMLLMWFLPYAIGTGTTCSSATRCMKPHAAGRRASSTRRGSLGRS